MSAVRRAVAVVALVMLVVAAAGLVSSPGAAARSDDSPPITLIPDLPEEIAGLTAGVSPVIWQSCKAVGLAFGLSVLAGTLVGVPPEVGEPLNQTVGTLSGPVLQLFFEACQQFPLPDEPPDCETDELVPLIPSLGRPIPPFALLANQLRALETSLQDAGLPLQGALSSAADDILACADGRNPVDDEPGSEGPDLDLAPETRPSEGGVPPLAPPTGGGGTTGDGGTHGATIAAAPDTAPSPAVRDPDSTADAFLSPALPITTTTDDRTLLAYLLLAATALAMLMWSVAGRRSAGVAP